MRKHRMLLLIRMWPGPEAESLGLLRKLMTMFVMLINSDWTLRFCRASSHKKSQAMSICLYPSGNLKKNKIKKILQWTILPYPFTDIALFWPKLENLNNLNYWAEPMDFFSKFYHSAFWVFLISYMLFSIFLYIDMVIIIVQNDILL